VQVYDPASNTWTLGPAMPWSARYRPAVIGGQLYARRHLSGRDHLATSAVLDPATGL
jgi:hypothetical protein